MGLRGIDLSCHAYSSLLFAASLAAANVGSISGTIADQTGAAITVATVTLRNAEIGVMRNSTSDAEGNFVFAGLVAGRYTIDAEHVGFTRYTKPEFALASGVTVHVQIAMEVEVHSDSVTITESSNQVQHGSAGAASGCDAGEFAAAERAPLGRSRPG